MIPADVKEKAVNLTEEIASRLGAYTPELQWLEHIITEALMQERSRADRIEAALLDAVTNNFWDAYHYGIEQDGRWWHGAMSDAEWLTRELDLPSGWNDASLVKAAIPSAVDRFIDRIRTDTTQERTP